MNKINKRFWGVPVVAVIGLGLAGCSGSSGGPTGPGTVTGPNVGLVGLSAAGDELIFFNAGQAQNVTRTANIQALGGGERLLSIDFRAAPRDGTQPGIYGLTNQNRLVLINTASGQLTQIGTPFSFDGGPALDGRAAIDVNPQADRIRLVQGSFNARLNPTVDPGDSPAVDTDMDTPGFQGDGMLRYADGDPGEGTTPNVVAAAYTNNDDDLTTPTTNYAIDLARGTLVTQGGNPAVTTPGDPNNPNSGVLFTVGPLGVGTLAGANVELEIVGNNTSTGLLHVSRGTVGELFQVNLSTGATTRLRGGRTAPLSGIAVAGQI